MTVGVAWYVIVENPLASIAFWGPHVPRILTVDYTFNFSVRVSDHQSPYWLLKQYTYHLHRLHMNWKLYEFHVICKKTHQYLYKWNTILSMRQKKSKRFITFVTYEASVHTAGLGVHHGRHGGFAASGELVVVGLVTGSRTSKHNIVSKVTARWAIVSLWIMLK